MSDASIEITLARAHQAVQRLRELLPLPEGSCPVVGSVRRCRQVVHDVELIAPMPAEGQVDRLWTAINDQAPDTSDLFAPQGPAKPVIRIVKGVKPLFAHARIQVKLKSDVAGGDAWLPIEIYRYDTDATKTNRGWIELMRTGPADFGKWFLMKWHDKWQLRPDRSASVDGYLRDEYEAIVPVATEKEAFEKCGIAYVAPDQRDVVARAVFAART